MNNDTSNHRREVAAGVFKARCLKLMDDVERDRVPIVITKRGRAVAKLVPVDERPPPLFGCLAGSVTIVGDIVAPVAVAWEANPPENDRGRS